MRPLGSGGRDHGERDHLTRLAISERHCEVCRRSNPHARELNDDVSVVSPAAAAEPPAITAVIRAPTGVFVLSTTVLARTPRSARCEFRTWPLVMIWLVMSLTVLAGMAKPMPFAAAPRSDRRQ